MIIDDSWDLKFDMVIWDFMLIYKLVSLVLAWLKTTKLNTLLWFNNMCYFPRQNCREDLMFYFSLIYIFNLFFSLIIIIFFRFNILPSPAYLVSLFVDQQM